MNGQDHQRCRILLVEDDPQVGDTMKMILELDGHAVVTASHGGAALKILDLEAFDLVITDFWMPVMKGDELAVNVRQRWPDLPIIMMSGSVTNDNILDPALEGVDCLLNKPFSLKQLREATHWALGRHPNHRLTGLGEYRTLNGIPNQPPARGQFGT